MIVACVIGFSLFTVSSVSLAGGYKYHHGYGYGHGHGYSYGYGNKSHYHGYKYRHNYGHKYGHKYRHNYSDGKHYRKHKRHRRNAAYLIGGLALGYALHAYTQPRYSNHDYHRYNRNYSYSPDYQHNNYHGYSQKKRYAVHSGQHRHNYSRYRYNTVSDCYKYEYRSNGHRVKVYLPAGYCH